MDTVWIRKIIIDALAHEKRTFELGYLLQSRLHHLHSAIHLSVTNPVANLLLFVRRYVERLPDILEAVGEISARDDTEEIAEAVSERCAALFAAPPALLDGHRGLNGCMNIAYMCHRLLEEINDSYLLAEGRMLAPIDTTRSNLIIHHLIGEGFANQLDDAVHLIARDLVMEKDTRGAPARQDTDPSAIVETLNRWPCLKDELAGDMILFSPARLYNVH
ncbi:MAG: hypothetical protein CMK32_05440 [Porticoccaceae bacterium]|nr:hypothetical protein [Porticoccaceae bacterium]